MGRLVNSGGSPSGNITRETGLESTAVAAGAATDNDNGLSRIAKYIPAEILAFFTMWTQGAAQLPMPEYLLTICVIGAVAGAIISFIYFDKFFPDAPEASRKAHKIISPLAFLVYSYTITGSVVQDFFIPGIALMATATITLVSYLVNP